MTNSYVTKSTELPLRFKEGAIIFAQGKMSKFLYLVKSGEVILVKFKGSSLTAIELCLAKDILNEVAILTNQPNELTAIAKTDVELVIVDHKDIQEVIKKSPEWISDIFQTLCERLVLTQEMINEHNLATEKDPRLFINKDDEKKYLSSLAEYNSIV